MGNIVSSNSNNSNTEQPNRRKPRIFGEKENNEPRSLIKFKQEDQSDAESEIVPIQIPEISREMTPQKQEDIYKVIVPSPRSDLGSEIEQLWNKAVQEQSCQLAKIITTYLEDGTMYNGEWFKGTMHGNGTLSREGLLLYEGEWKLGKRVEMELNTTRGELMIKLYQPVRYQINNIGRFIMAHLKTIKFMGKVFWNQQMVLVCLENLQMDSCMDS